MIPRLVSFSDVRPHFNDTNAPNQLTYPYIKVCKGSMNF